MCAVVVRSAVKTYPFCAVPVLDGLNMDVPQGSIYGLLGASGCGKTTLLSCIVGSKKLNQGNIWVLGNERGCERSKSMGSLLGYMPQDIALIGELSIKDCAIYFGKIYGMDQATTLKKFNFLESLLDLPRGDKFVRNLSGGQQRRASLAIALIHTPELLILDEPTVGLDPVLRQNIWDYLLHLTLDYQKTIIITTHYIEEARQAHVIGLMRNGRLLEEGCPEGLLSKYNAYTIEQVFLQLCSSQDRCQGSPQQAYRPVNQEKLLPPLTQTKGNDFYYSPPYRSNSVTREAALVLKNILRVLRHPG